MSKQAFTTVFQGNALGINTLCKVCGSYDYQIDREFVHPDFETCRAQWDTGAVMSVISSSVATDMNLQPFGVAKMIHANGESFVKTYFINLLLPNKIEIQVLQVMEGNMADTDILIGMDVIGLCDFAITHKNGDTVFSFDIPSCHFTDYREIE